MPFRAILYREDPSAKSRIKLASDEECSRPRKSLPRCAGVWPRSVKSEHHPLLSSRLTTSDCRSESLIVRGLSCAAICGRWQIDDIYLDGTISQLAVRRSEFLSILQNQGANGLIPALSRKVIVLIESSS